MEGLSTEPILLRFLYRFSDEETNPPRAEVSGPTSVFVGEPIKVMAHLTSELDPADQARLHWQIYDSNGVTVIITSGRSSEITFVPRIAGVCTAVYWRSEGRKRIPLGECRISVTRAPQPEPLQVPPRYSHAVLGLVFQLRSFMLTNPADLGPVMT